jgi:hypothetical protein
MKNPFIQGIRPGRNANGIDQARGEEGLDLFQIVNLLLSLQGRETPTVECNLFFPSLTIKGKLDKGGFDESSNRRGRRKSFSRCLLVAEETAVMTTRIRKKNRNDQWRHK